MKPSFITSDVKLIYGLDYLGVTWKWCTKKQRLTSRTLRRL